MILYHTYILRLPVRPAMTVDIFRDCHVAMLLAMTVGVLLVITVSRNDREGGVRGVRRLWFGRGRL